MQQQTPHDCLTSWHRIANQLDQAADIIAQHTSARASDINTYRQSARLYRDCANQLGKALLRQQREADA